jgi:peptidoglycan/LPS O-acetylase OafA/YrhL
MKRVAALDLLRGLAAFAVAVPHYLTLNATGWIEADILAVTAVEIFFVLSGFVLAPQILTQVLGHPARNLRTFLARRWMRTIPPFLVALLCVSYVTGQLWTADSARYAFYAQNLFFQANMNDYYPVAWSLSVEEWFYVTFAPLAFIVALICKSDAWKTSVFVGIGLITAIALARSAFGDYSQWDAEVRRVVVFRIDSIVFGFLLYVAVTKLDHGVRPSIRLGLPLFVICSAIAGLMTYLTTKGDILSERLFPYAAAAMGISAVWLAHKAEFLFAGRKLLSDFSTYLGGVSYSVYLFHIILVMILKPKLQHIDLIWQMLVYLTCLLAWCSLFWIYFEKPILAARPKYRVKSDLGGAPALVSQA